MRIAILIKQVPKFESMALGPDGRLQRAGLVLEMNPYCRRAVAKGVELTRQYNGQSLAITLGPPAAEDILREAVAWGVDRGVLVTDPAFAGSDTLATARALAATIDLMGPFDVVLLGRNSVDADTGQVGPELAELLDLPFVGGVRQLTLSRDRLEAKCESDDGYRRVSTFLPALLSCAERLCDPCKVAPDDRSTVDPSLIMRVTARDLGRGPWGQAGSPTTVGRVKVMAVERARIRLTGSAAEQVANAVTELRRLGVTDLTAALPGHGDQVVPPPSDNHTGPTIAVVVEPGRSRTTAELLGAAAAMATEIQGRVTAVAFQDVDTAELSARGADGLIQLHGATVEEDVARGLLDVCYQDRPWAVLAPSTMWGREVCGRVAAHLGAGLTGDAVDLALEGGRLVGWKPAFGGALVAAVTADSEIQMVTVRPGMLPLPRRRLPTPILTLARRVEPRGRVVERESSQDDDYDTLVTARAVIGVGAAVAPEEYPKLEPLLGMLSAELGGTRKVTDKGWLPRARQIGITGRSIAPRLYLAIALSGKFNHMVGVRGAGVVVAINNDPEAMVFDHADLGLVGDWREVVPLLTEALSTSLSEATSVLS